MAEAGTEIEVKFLVASLATISERLRLMGAGVVSERVLERNLRFDLPDGRFLREGRALRLRQDHHSTITYKGPGQYRGGIRRRPEFDVRVEDFDAAQKLIEALGYVVSFRYEKYRTTYSIADVQVMLDELPYGDFVEIEGQPDGIRSAAARLGLNWDAAVEASYMALFEIVKSSRDLKFTDLTFDLFRGVGIEPGDLGAEPADQ